MGIFADRLRALRLNANETQGDLAKILGVSIQSYSAYEAAREPRYDLLCMLADHFKVTTDYLVGRSNFKTWESVDIHEVTGLSDAAIFKISQFRVMGTTDVLNALLCNTNFISALYQIRKMLECGYDPSDYYNVLRKADYDAVVDGGEGASNVIPGSELNSVIINRAKEDISKAMYEVAVVYEANLRKDSHAPQA
jgi:transcriptional regulator with XRE-family HTH domain